MDRKNVLFFALVICLIVILGWTQIRASRRPAQDNDEGIYLTTFLLISNNHPAYRDTFLSQPPFFILSVYPLFSLLGKSLPAARIATGLWALAGIAALIWIGWELDKKWLGWLTAGLLYLIPRYVNQTVIFQSDIIASSLSLLALSLFISFTKRRHISLFVACLLFVNMALWTKMDITLLPALIAGTVYLHRKQWLLLSGIALIVSLLFFLICIAPFGIQDMINNVIRLRLQAAALPQPPLWLFQLLRTDLPLLILTAIALLFPVITLHRLKPVPGLVAVWCYTAFASLIFYRPLFDHHLVILCAPVALMSAWLITDWLRRMGTTIAAAGTIGVLLVALISRIIYVRDISVSQLSVAQRAAVSCIMANTNPRDLIVSDEEILMPASGRLPPPPLSDVSLIRISSSNLTGEMFQNILSRYKPKMVISWNGKLATLPRFQQQLTGYVEIPCIGENKNQHMYLRQ